MSKIKWNPELNLSTVVHLIGWACSLLAIYFTMDKRVTILENDKKSQIEINQQVTRLLEKVTEQQIEFGRIQAVIVSKLDQASNIPRPRKFDGTN